MPSTCFVYHPVYLKHQTGPGHPESSRRLDAILQVVTEFDQQQPLLWLTPGPAEFDQISSNHHPDYIKRVESACKEGQTVLDSMDTGICSCSYEAALTAAGAGITATDAVMEGRVRNGFAAVRPPGHHAEYDLAMGFCLFNNVAITARYLRDRWFLKRILIVDWDVHHGNGTQNAFYENENVFYFSIHQYPHYPGTGHGEENGRGKGEGTTLNVPMPPGSNDEAYRKAFKNTLLPAAETFKPDFVLVSAGFDAHASDPLSDIQLSTGCFGELTDEVKAIAERHCQGRLVSFLEGGYDCNALSQSVVEHIRRLSQEVAA